MLDHVSIGVVDTARAKTFYDAALQPLGYTCLSQSEGSLGYGAGEVALWISEVSNPVRPDMRSGLHFCFAAPGSTRSTRAVWPQAARTMAHRACAPTITTTTTPPS